MKKFNLIKQKNNLISKKIIMKMYNNDKFLYCHVLSMKELIKFCSKELKLNLSENRLLSEHFLKDLLEIKLNNKEFIYL